VAEFKVDAARQLLEAEVRDTFLGTAGAAAGVRGSLVWVAPAAAASPQLSSQRHYPLPSTLTVRNAWLAANMRPSTGAQGIGLLATGIIGNTLEDILALTVAGNVVDGSAQALARAGNLHVAPPAVWCALALKSGLTVLAVLAVLTAGLASYVAVLNLPLKRSDIKAKVAKVAGNFVEGVSTAMAEVGEGGAGGPEGGW
jgi:hypothetical protein